MSLYPQVFVSVCANVLKLQVICNIAAFYLLWFSYWSISTIVFLLSLSFRTKIYFPNVRVGKNRIFQHVTFLAGIFIRRCTRPLLCHYPPFYEHPHLPTLHPLKINTQSCDFKVVLNSKFTVYERPGFLPLTLRSLKCLTILEDKHLSISQSISLICNKTKWQTAPDATGLLKT